MSGTTYNPQGGPLSPTMISLLNQVGGDGMGDALAQLFTRQGTQPGAAPPQLTPQQTQAMQGVAGLNWGSPAGMQAQDINSTMDQLSRAFKLPMAAWRPSDVQGLLGGAVSSSGSGGTQ